MDHRSHAVCAATVCPCCLHRDHETQSTSRSSSDHGTFFGQRNGFVTQRKTQKLELRTKLSIQDKIILSVGEPPSGAKLWRRSQQQGKQEEEDPLQGEEEGGHHLGNEVVRSHQQVQENTTFLQIALNLTRDSSLRACETSERSHLHDDTRMDDAETQTRIHGGASNTK